MISRFFACLFVFLLIPVGAFSEQPISPSQTPPPGAPPPLPGEPGQPITAPPLKRVSEGVFEIGGVRIMKKEGKVVFPAAVNMDKGLLEYLVVGRGGKLHESLLKTDVEPYSLQIALLLMGLEGTAAPLAGQGDPRSPEGDPVTLWIELGKGDAKKRIRMEEWVINQNTGKAMKPMKWVFTGSIVMDGVFMAQVEKSIVAVFHDPIAMIDNPLPEGASDELWFVNEKKVPPVGTEVLVVIEK